MEHFSGKIYTMGDDIDTDIIMPTEYLALPSVEDMKPYAFSPLRPELAGMLEPGDCIVAGKNFGCGSSREHAPMALKAAGISCVIAKNFARIFYRNSFNTGFLILECDETDKIAQGDELSIDLKGGVIKNLTQKTEYKFGAIPEFMQKLLDAGGAINYAKTKINL